MVVDVAKLAEGVMAGDVRAVSRAISAVENGSPWSFELLKALYPRTGTAHVIGITGPPGAGKSTLTDRLVETFRRRGRTVGVIAVDPTSPFTGGAILGDRVRMSRHFTDPGVFIRSMATRGALGGISRGAYDAVTVLEASGMDVVIIETVGVGQDEIDVINIAHSSAVILIPGMGDEIQAIKAGILEIGDLFIVNKADRAGVERLVTELQLMLDLAGHDHAGEATSWRPPIIKTIASDGSGIEEVADAFEAHHRFINNRHNGHEREVRRSGHRLRELWKEAAMDRLLPQLLPEPEFAEAVERIAAREAEPYTLIENMLKRLEQSLS